MLVSSMRVDKARSIAGQWWYVFSIAKLSVWLSAKIATGNPAKLHEALREHGFVFTDDRLHKRLIEAVAQAKRYKGPAPIDRPGWNKGQFALANGAIYAEHKERSAPVFPKEDVAQSSGTLQSWNLDVGAKVMKHDFPSFIIMLTLAAPVAGLLPMFDTYPVEAVLDSEHQSWLISTLVGCVNGRPRNSHHFPQFNVASALRDDRLLSPYADLLSVLTNSNLALHQLTPAKRASFISDLFDLTGSGGTPHAAGSRIHLFVNPKPLAEMVGAENDLGREVAARLISLNFKEARLNGMFESSAGGPSANALADELQNAAHNNHGALLHHFLNKLTKTYGSNTNDLALYIDKHTRVFDIQCAKQNLFISFRDLKFFGLVYATGKLAKSWKLLPPGFRPGHSTLNVYKKMRASAQQNDPVKTLKELLAHESAMHLGRDQDGVQDRPAADCNLFVMHRKEYVEIWMRPRAVASLIPGCKPSTIRSDLERFLVRDDRHLKTKRSVPPRGKQERLFVFRLSAEDLNGSVAP